MIAVVTIDDDGAVSVTVDTDEADADEARPLVGLVLDDILAKAAETAVCTWVELRTEVEAEAGL